MSESSRPPVPPHVIEVDHPVRVALIGGFLGAGKTTAIGALAAELARRGKRVAIVTNDQAAGLVDTALGEHQGVPVAEVAGGCFCCRFDDMLDAVLKVLADQPDVVLCEPVGSCTDMAATVLNPLKVYYPHAFSLAPFAVLADPRRVRECVLGEARTLFGPEVGYIYRKQLDEADAIVLTKTDRIDAREADRLAGELVRRYVRPVLRTAAIRGEGIAELADLVLSTEPAGGHVLGDVDYDMYAKGEAELGWLNATATLSAPAPFDAQRLVATLVEGICVACAEAGADIAHLKAAVDGGKHFARAHVTALDEPVACHPDAPVLVPAGELILNARIGMAPEALEQAARQAVAASAAGNGVAVQFETIRCFRPGYPDPPYLLRGAR